MKKFFLIFSILLFSCYSSNKGLYYKEISNLEKILEREYNNNLHKFLLTSRIVNLYLVQNEYESAIKLVSKALVNKSERDSYYPLYIYLLANIYENKGEQRVAYTYYFYVINNFVNFIYQDQDLHTLIAKRIVNLNIEAEKKIEFYDLILRDEYTFSISDKAYYYYNFGLALEEAQYYERAYEYYAKLITFPRAFVNLDSQSYSNIQSKVKFFRSAEKVVYKNLNNLISDIKKYVANKNALSFYNLRSRSNFFIQSWDNNGRTNKFDVYSFLTTMVNISRTSKNSKRIIFSENLEPESNQDTAYLKSKGWSYIEEWYFVFKRVSYPQDPEIHNRWMWIGIYLGNK